MKKDLWSLWRAWCTTAWFATGIKVRNDDTSYLGHKLYEWFLEIDARIEE